MTRLRPAHGSLKVPRMTALPTRSWIGPLMMAGLLAVAVFGGCSGDPGERATRSAFQNMERGNLVRARADFEKALRAPLTDEARARVLNGLGLVFLRLGEADEAARCFERTLALTPDSASATFNLGMARAQSGSLDEALEAFRRTAQLTPESDRPHGASGFAYFKAGDAARAHQAFLSALARRPRSPEWLTWLALAEWKAGQPDRAEFYCMQALEQDRRYAPALYNLARIYDETHARPDQARAYYEGFLDVEPEGTRADRVRARLAEQAGARAAALPVNETRTPSAAASRAGQPVESAAAARAPEARELAARGQTAEALRYYLEAAEAARAEGDTSAQRDALIEATSRCFDQPGAFVALGRYLLDTGERTSAEEQFKKALRLDENATDAIEGLARARLQAGQAEDALLLYKQVLQRQPDHRDAAWHVAELYDTKLGMTNEALAAYRAFLVLAPHDARAAAAKTRIVERLAPTRAPAETPRPTAPVPTTPDEPAEPAPRNPRAAAQAYNMGLAHQERGDWDRAVYYYENAIENDPLHAMAWYNLGTVYWNQREDAKAAEAYRKVLALRPNLSSARYNLSLALQRLGEADEALDRLRALVADEPAYAGAYYVIGMIRSAQPDGLNDARAAYARYLELAPNDAYAPLVRRWLQQHPALP